MPNLTPPSAALLPSEQLLRERLAIALREVDLLRRLIRAVASVRPYTLTTAEKLPSPQTKGGRDE